MDALLSGLLPRADHVMDITEKEPEVHWVQTGMTQRQRRNSRDAIRQAGLEEEAIDILFAKISNQAASGSRPRPYEYKLDLLAICASPNSPLSLNV